MPKDWGSGVFVPLCKGKEKKKQRVYVHFMYFEKGYDMVNREALW